MQLYTMPRHLWYDIFHGTVDNRSLQFSSVHFSSVSSIVLWGKVSERPAWKDESWALIETDCNWWTGSEGEAVVNSRQLELQWRSSAFRAFWVALVCGINRSPRTAWIVSDCACNATEVGRSSVPSQKSVQQFWTVSSEIIHRPYSSTKFRLVEKMATVFESELGDRPN